MYNYADDNTLSKICSSFVEMKDCLEKECKILIDWFDSNGMKANPEKFQAICFGKKTSNSVNSFNIGGLEISCQETVKLLGIDIDFLLKFDIHVSRLCRNASKQLAVLKRLGSNLTKKGKVTIFKSFILSNFNYCPLAWHFCTLTNTRKMEKVQERALRFIENNYTSPVSDILRKFKLDFLHVTRIKYMASEVFKILNGMSPSILESLIERKEVFYNLRLDNLVGIPKVYTSTYGKRSFRFSASQVWNSLPNQLRLAENYESFRRLLRTWDTEVCSCTICTHATV